MIMNDEFIESPAIGFGRDNQRRGAVIYLGHKMFKATAVRMAQYRKDFCLCRDKGMTLAQAGKRIGFTKPTMMKWAKIFKIEFKQERKRTYYRHRKAGWYDIIMDGLRKGYTFEQLDEALGVARNNAYHYCKSHNINPAKIKQDAKNNR